MKVLECPMSASVYQLVPLMVGVSKYLDDRQTLITLAPPLTPRCRFLTGYNNACGFINYLTTLDSELIYCQICLSQGRFVLCHQTSAFIPPMLHGVFFSSIGNSFGIWRWTQAEQVRPHSVWLHYLYIYIHIYLSIYNNKPTYHRYRPLFGSR